MIGVSPLWLAIRNALQSGATWASDKLMAANIPGSLDYGTRLFANQALLARGFAPTGDPYSSNNVALKGDGYPQDGTSFCVVCMANIVPTDIGVYQCSFTGQASSIVALGGFCAVSGVSYSAGTGKTTFQVTCANTSESGIGIQFNSVTSFADLAIMRPGLSVGTLFPPELVTHLAPFKALRFMDILLVNNSTEVDWVGSSAAGALDPIKYSNSLKCCYDLAALYNTDLWVNFPHKFTDSAIASFVNECATRTPAGKTCYIEFSNEVWNAMFTQFVDVLNAAWDATGGAARAAVNTRPGYLTGVQRVSNVVTLTFDASVPVTNIVGSTIYFSGISGFSAGARTVTAVTSNSVSYSQTGADATGTVATNDYNQYVYLDVTHKYTKTQNVWNPSYPDAYAGMMYRYVIDRLRVAYNAIVAAGATDRLKIVLAFQQSTASLNAQLGWAQEQFGVAPNTWISAFSVASYSLPSNASTMTTADAVFTQLETSRIAVRKNLARLANGVRHFGIPLIAYEGGPHTDSKPDLTVAAAVQAAHRDDRMRTHIKAILDDWRSAAGGQFYYFTAGSAQTFGTTQNNTWALVEGDLTDGPNQAKYKAITEQVGASSVAKVMDTVNWGTIFLGDILAAGWGGFNSTTAPRSFFSSQVAPTDAQLYIVAPADGNYTITLQAEQTGGTSAETVTLLIDGTIVSGPTILPVGTNVNTAAEYVNMTPVPVTLTKGDHWLTIRMRASRTGSVGFKQVTLA